MEAKGKIVPLKKKPVRKKKAGKVKNDNPNGKEDFEWLLGQAIKTPPAKKI